jgi:hypothetical protein
MASDTMFAVAKGNTKDLPFYDLIQNINTPYAPKEGSVTSDKYASSLSTYNEQVASYKTDQSAYEKSSEISLGIYNTKLQEFNADKATYEKGGSIDPSMYASLKTRYSELQSLQGGLDAQASSFGKLEGTYNQLELNRISLENQSKNIENPPTPFDTIGKIYESANKGLAPYTTDVVGIGKMLQATPDVDLKQYGGETVPQGYSDVINITKGAYVGASQNPLDIVATYFGGKALGVGERIIAGGVAKAAMGELPLLSRIPWVATVGRVASTPVASDVVTIGKTMFGGYVAVEAGANIISQPTATGKGEAFGRTAIQFGGFGAGMVKGDISSLPGETPNRITTLLSGYNNYVKSEPTNAFAGRTLSGVLADSPMETARSYASMQLNRLTMSSEESAIYRNNWDIARAVKYIEPAKLTEPDVGQLSRVPPEHIMPIQNTVRDVPFVGQGSGFVQAQRSTLPTGDRLGLSKDLDGFSKGFMDRIAEEPGATRMSVATPHGGEVKDTVFINRKPVAADIHEFPVGYPEVGQSAGVASRPTIGFPESKSPDVHDVGWGTRLLGQPLKPQPTSLTQIRNPQTEGNTGDIFMYEKENIQAVRVLEAANRDLQTLSGENTRGYRLEKDIYRSKTVPEELIAVERARGTAQSKAMGPLFKKADAALADNMKRSITFERNAGSIPETRTIGEIYAEGLSNVQAGKVPYQFEFVATETPNVFQLKSGTAGKYGFAEERRFNSEVVYRPPPTEAPNINTVNRYSGAEYTERILARQKMYESLPENAHRSYQGGQTTMVVPENKPTMSISTINRESTGVLPKSSTGGGIYSFAPSYLTPSASPSPLSISSRFSAPSSQSYSEGSTPQSPKSDMSGVKSTSLSPQSYQYSMPPSSPSISQSDIFSSSPPSPSYSPKSSSSPSYMVSPELFGSPSPISPSKLDYPIVPPIPTSPSPTSPTPSIPSPPPPYIPPIYSETPSIVPPPPPIVPPLFPLPPLGSGGGGTTPALKNKNKSLFTAQFLYGQGISSRMFGSMRPLNFSKSAPAPRKQSRRK